MKPKGRLREVNDHLKSIGSLWTLIRSRAEYHYFIHETLPPTTGIYVYRTASLSVEQWVRELDHVTIKENQCQ